MLAVAFAIRSSLIMPAGQIRPTVSPAFRYTGFRLISGDLFKIKKPDPDNTDFVNDRLFMPLYLMSMRGKDRT
jgi:hypothetical protein